MISLEQTELKTALFEMKIAQANYIAAWSRLRPSHNLPITIKREGSRWVCLLESDPDPLNCPIAYGESPSQAMSNFDNLWNGAGIILQEPEDEEEPL